MNDTKMNHRHPNDFEHNFFILETRKKTNGMDREMLSVNHSPYIWLLQYFIGWKYGATAYLHITYLHNTYINIYEMACWQAAVVHFG